jgi:prepilin-type N-terminal cleavage/methylation domain-containing protein
MRRRESSGYTLVELLVALAVLAILTAQLFVVFSSQKRAYVNNERVLDVQEDARLVMDLLTTETRMAGYMVPRRAGVSSRDGGNGAADALCVSDPSVLDEDDVRTEDDRYDRATVASITAGGGAVTVSSIAQLDVDGADAAVDFAEDAGIILADGAHSHCARITDVNVATGEVEFTPAIPLYNTWTVGQIRATPAIVYEVSGGGLGLTRNSLLLSGEVEDLQVEYGVDVNDDEILDMADSTEWPLDDLDGVDSQDVRSVRLTVTTRTTQADNEYTGPGRAAAANRTAGGGDSFRRRRFVASVLPRNLL